MIAARGTIITTRCTDVSRSCYPQCLVPAAQFSRFPQPVVDRDLVERMKEIARRHIAEHRDTIKGDAGRVMNKGQIAPIKGKRMPYLIDATDKPESAALRTAERLKHLAYIDSNLPLLIAGEPKLRDDGETACGTLYIVDVDDRAAAETFIKNDPFSKAGLFDKVEITRWRKVVFDGKKIPPKT
jgi:uncharacterized protein YciI